MIVPRRAVLALALAAALLAAPSCGPGPAAPSVQVGNFTLTYTQVSARRVSRTLFEYTYDADLTNNGPTVATGATATVSSLAATTVVTDSTLTFGNLNPGQTLASVDTFVIEQDRTAPFAPADLVFQVMAGTGGGTPTAPAGLEALAGDGVVLLEWDADPTPGTTYNVFRATDPSAFANFAPINTAPVPSADFKDTAASNGTAFYYAVTAERGAQSSAFSEVVGARPPGFQNAPIQRQGADLVLSGRLFALQKLLDEGEPLAGAATGSSVGVNPNGQILLAAEANGGNASSLVSGLSAAGASAITTSGATAIFLAPATSLRAIAAVPGLSGLREQFPATSFQALPTTPAMSEGVRTVGALDLQMQGITGKGATVGVFDAGFTYASGNPTSTIGSLTRPSDGMPVVVHRYCPAGIGPDNGPCNFTNIFRAAMMPGLPAFPVDRFFAGSRGNHGDTVVHIVNQMAPDAEIALYAPETPPEYVDALMDARTRVDAVNASIGFEFPSDDRDATAPRGVLADNEAMNNLVIVHAAGNSGFFKAATDTLNPNAGGWHQWSGAYPTVLCDAPVPGNPGASTPVPCLPFTGTPGSQLYMEWDEWPQLRTTQTDLDVFVFATQLGTPIAGAPPGTRGPALWTQGSGFGQGPTPGPGGTAPSPDNRIPVEIVGFGATSVSGPLFLAVRRQATLTSRNPRFHVLLSPANTASQFSGMPPATVPTSVPESAAAAPNVYTVGATHWMNDNLEAYSSRGPVADATTGMLSRNKPDIAAPDCVSNPVGTGPFCGTSAAAPHVTGAMALLMEACMPPRRCMDSAGAPVDPALPADLRRYASDLAFDLGHKTITHGPAVPANAWGAGRLDVSPPIVFQGDDAKLYVRHATIQSDATDGLRRLTNMGGTENDPHVSYDGQWVVFASNTSGASEIWKVRIDDPTTATQLTFGGTPQASFQPTWSPDGQQIAFIRRNRFFTSGGTLALAFVLATMNADGSSPTFVTTYDATLADNHGAAFPSWSPDGNEISFTQMEPQPGGSGIRFQRYDIAVVPASPSSAIRLPLPAASLLTSVATDGVSAVRSRYAKDGRYLLYQSLAQVPTNPFPLQLTTNSTIKVLDLTSGPSPAPLTLAESGNDPEFSPAATRILFSRQATGTPSGPTTSRLHIGWFDPAMANLVDVYPATNGVDDTTFQQQTAW